VNPAALYGVSAIAAFVLGSIPWGVVVGRVFYRRDIRAAGSGNIGAMNALRALGKRGAVAVLLLDAAKGVVPPALAIGFAHDLRLAAIVAAAAVLGHCYSPWLAFKGGKGVATSFGAIFALSWPAGIVTLLGWLVGAISTTYSSVGSMLGSIAAPFALWYFTKDAWVTGYGVFAALLILYMHRENIGRIQAGQEKGIPFLQRKPASRS
jgi:acyl phosphate:glycerol-3-phosphate acyltransferase